MSSKGQGQRLMIPMLRAYMDDSGSGGDSAYYVLSGVCGPVVSWVEFEEQWQAVLDDHPRIEYFKMSEAESRKREFQGVSIEERDGKLKRFIDVISKFKLLEFSCYVKQSDFDEVVRPFLPQKYHDPYFFLFPGVIESCVRYAGLEHHGAQVDFIFDESQKIERLAQPFYGQLRFRPRYKKSVGIIEHRSDRVFLPLQAADLIAWQTRRFLCCRDEPMRKELGALHTSGNGAWARTRLRRKQLLDLVEQTRMDEREGR
jgi:hypothetical protein